MGLGNKLLLCVLLVCYLSSLCTTESPTSTGEEVALDEAEGTADTTEPGEDDIVRKGEEGRDNDETDEQQENPEEENLKEEKEEDDDDEEEGLGEWKEEEAEEVPVAEDLEEIDDIKPENEEELGKSSVNNGEEEDVLKRKKRAAQVQLSPLAKSLMGKTFNFNNLTKYTKNVKLTLQGKPINLAQFKVDQTNVAQLDRFLKGETLADRLYVAAVIAGVEQSIAGVQQKRIKNLALDDLEDEDNDIVLTPDDADEIQRQIEEDKNILKLNSIAPVQDKVDKVAPGNSAGSPGRIERVKRKIVANSTEKWTTTIHYVITLDFNPYPSTRSTIDAAVRHWEGETCLDFRKVLSHSGSHIQFRRLGGCWSKVGRKGGGQIISIGTGCETKGIVAHEIGHALGFWHEQSRPDRSNYVTINTANIKPGESINFLRTSWKEVLALGVPYDYASLMHYGTHAFSQNGRPTLSAIQTDMTSSLGQRIGLSFFDVKLANLRYCAHKCRGGLAWYKCKNGGYRNPDNCNTCKCPDGWTGTYCTVVASAVRASCGRKVLPATSSWSTFTSPNYDTPGFPANAECTWRIITSSTYRRVVMQFIDKFQLHTSCPRTCRNYVELRFQDAARSGPRICCRKPYKYFKSHGSEMNVLMRINSGSGLDGFKIRYRYESCGAYRVNSGPPCIDTQPYTCYGFYYERCGIRLCKRYRQNTCYREVKRCAYGRKLVFNRCYREWSDWSSWSSCTGSCGGCGTRTRTRTCLRGPCRGSSRQTRSCNIKVCTKICYRKTKCGLFGWRRCTRSSPCGTYCCPGKRRVNNLCL